MQMQTKCTTQMLMHEAAAAGTLPCNLQNQQKDLRLLILSPTEAVAHSLLSLAEHR